MKDSHFYIQNEESWLRIPETNRSIPIPEGLHLMVLKFAAMQHIPIDSYLFYDNNGKKYTYQSFRKGAMSSVIIPELSEPPVRTLGSTIPENESHIFR